MGLFGTWFGGAAAHDEAAALYQQYLPMLRRRCRRLLRDDVLVDDALQEIFVAIFRGIGQFRGGAAQVLPWLYRITTTHCLRLLEREQRWSRLVTLAWDEEETLLDVYEPQAGTDAEKQAVLGQVLSRLPAVEREVLVLRYISGLGQEEIAAVMGVSRNQVRRWLSSATEKGRRMLS